MGREGEQERDRKNKALLSRAEVGCTCQDGHMAGSEQCQLLREGIPGGCLQRVCRTQEGTGVLDIVHLQSQHDVPPLHERVH